ncbi:MAG: glucose-6-phosphate isomerase [Calditrichaeota bacterium]|nr:glucose-6-phosphate isomerase [Candidatus Cloacimonadota bacterium]MCB1046829.1 glucose-6-phosphate isomerase [Calditrichota bacterium]MCB9473516.1 glucose-6-phosphate isomerase [Candidatus Delongbacteria bacterium]
MFSLLHLDLNRMLSANLPDGRGLDSASLHELVAGPGQAIRRKLEAMVLADEGTFANTFRRPEIGRALELAESFAGRFRNFVLVGIGGSTWGTLAIQAALCHSNWNEVDSVRGGCPRFYCLDNSDPDALSDLLEMIDPGETLVNVVSKSGTTAETAANFATLAGRFRESIGDDWASHFVLTTDQGDGLLQRIGREHGMAVLDIPPKTGGRFSLLTAVGLFPAAILGLDVRALVAGAEAITMAAIEEPLDRNRVLLASAASWLAYQQLATVNVVMPYARGLRYVANWYVQLWGESLGKKLDRQGRVVHSGSTPLGALGAADQHSLLQLFMEGPLDKLVTFVRVERFARSCPIASAFPDHPEVAYLGGHDMASLINAEQESTAEALRAAGRPSRTIELPEISAYWLGQLFQFLMLETFVNGELMDLNTFDQPGVEAGKLLTYGAMGRPGFSHSASTFNERMEFRD